MHYEHLMNYKGYSQSPLIFGVIIAENKFFCGYH